ncbi:uncharacterized protein ACNLHF_019843 isoform 2-T2 [Anomaloglossus baeobatrachus]
MLIEPCVEPGHYSPTAPGHRQFGLQKDSVFTDPPHQYSLIQHHDNQLGRRKQLLWCCHDGSWKHHYRFMTYSVRATNLFERNCTLFKSCEFFMKVTEDIQKRLSKGISREVVGKRYLALTTSQRTPQECRKILDVAKQPFLKCVQAAKHGCLLQSTQLEILYYLQALLVLKHLQRPGVLQHMTVSEWKERIGQK